MTSKTAGWQQERAHVYGVEDATARHAVAVGDAKTLRKYLASSLSGNGREVAGVVGKRSGWRLCLLHLAAFEGSVGTILLLLAAGASINAQDLDGWTPLHYAARNETDGEAAVRTLVAAGAVVDKTNNLGRTALHIAYLSRNFQAASELREHGASTTLRDCFGKTAPQMLEQKKTARHRPWSSSAISGSSRELSSFRRRLPCPDGPRSATVFGGNPSARPRNGPSGNTKENMSGLAADSDIRPLDLGQDEIDAGESLSTLQRSSRINAEGESVLTVVVGDREGVGDGDGGYNRSAECWPCDREMAILEHRGTNLRQLDGNSTGITASAIYGGGGGRGRPDHSSPCSFSGLGNEAGHGNSGEEARGAVGGTYPSRNGVPHRRHCHHPPSTSPGADTLLVENSAFGTLSTSETPGGPASAAGGQARSGTPKDDNDVAAEQLRPHGEVPVKVEPSFSRVRHHSAKQGRLVEENAVEERGRRLLNPSRGGGESGGGGGVRIARTSSPTQRARRRRCNSRKAGRRRGGKALVPRGRAPGGGEGKDGQARSGGGCGSPILGRRRFYFPGDEVPEYVIGRRRMRWAQKSAQRHAQLVTDVHRRREEIASPRRMKLAAAAEEKKRRAANELKRKQAIRDSPLRWGRDGRPCSSPAKFLINPRGGSLESYFSSPTQLRRRPSTAGPYGGGSCMKCDPRSWYRGKFVGELGGLGFGTERLGAQQGRRQREKGKEERGGMWNMTITDRYRLLRRWTTLRHDERELWWAKPRLSGSGTAMVVKVPAAGKSDETGWEAFVREWGVLKYLQEEGHVGGKAPLSVGLVGAFEAERSLVLSIPAGSRTLREVGQQINSEMEGKKKRISQGVFNDQVESLAAQTCRTVCWLHRCGIISGDVTPDNFVFLGVDGSNSGGLSDSRGEVNSPANVWGRGEGGDSGGRGGKSSSNAVRYESGLRLVIGRSVARRSNAAGGCPQHPLLERVSQNFPLCQAFDKAYASPERLQAALSDVPCPAEVAEDAWGLGMIVFWLLTGREDYVPGTRVQALIGGRELCQGSESPLIVEHDQSPRADCELVCPGTVCSTLPVLLSSDPRRREAALALAGRHVDLLERNPLRSPSPTTPPAVTSTAGSPRGRKGSGYPLHGGQRTLLVSISPAPVACPPRNLPTASKGDGPEIDIAQAAKSGAAAVETAPKPAATEIEMAVPESRTEAAAIETVPEAAVIETAPEAAETVPEAAVPELRTEAAAIEPAPETKTNSTAKEHVPETPRDGGDCEPSSSCEGIGARQSETQTHSMAVSTSTTTLMERKTSRCLSTKSVGVGGSPADKSEGTRQSICRIATASKSLGLRLSIGVGTSPSTSPRPRPETRENNNHWERSPTTGDGQLLGEALPSADDVGRETSRPAAVDVGVSVSSKAHGGSCTSGSDNNPTTAVEKRIDNFEDERAEPTAFPTTDDLDATLLVECPAGETDCPAIGCYGEQASNLEATDIDSPADKNIGEALGGRTDIIAGASSRLEEEQVTPRENGDGSVEGVSTHARVGCGSDAPSTENGGLQPRNKKRNRVAPMDVDNTPTRTPYGESPVKEPDGSTAHGTNIGDGARSVNSNVAHSDSSVGSTKLAKIWVQQKRLSVDDGVHGARPAEASSRLAAKPAGGKCSCTVM